jgi:hypothetical protein
MVFERIIVGAVIGMRLLKPQNSIVLGFITLQIIVIAIKRPYVGERSNLRPILNLIITLLISVIFMIYPLISRSMA